MASLFPVKTFVLSIGNTSLFGGVFDHGKLVIQFRVPLGVPKRIRPALRRALTRMPRQIDGAALCSVVPKLTKPLVREIQRRFGVSPKILHAQADHGLTIGYRNPREIGSDRIAAALGARALLGPRHVIVVDCGTATTVTALRKDGTLLGGAIFPGLALWPRMLAAKTAQLPAIALVKPQAALGRSTAAALRSGFFHGHAGAMRELVVRIRREAFGRSEVPVLGTGGNGPWFLREQIFSRFEPALVLVGLDYFARELAAHPSDRL